MSHVFHERRDVRENPSAGSGDQPLKIRNHALTRQAVTRPQLYAPQRGVKPGAQDLTHARGRRRGDPGGESLGDVTHGDDGVLRCSRVLILYL